MSIQFPATGGRVLPAKGRGPRILPRRPRPPARPRHRISQLLAWADDHFHRTGVWPTNSSGKVLAAPFENWGAIEAALINGYRGLRPGSSIARLLEKHGRKYNLSARKKLSIKTILEWADEHHRRTGQWPNYNSRQAVFGRPSENWRQISVALRSGLRGLPGGTSLAQLLAKHRSVRNVNFPPPLTERQILAWADDHFNHTGKWPTQTSGKVRGARGETWTAVQLALSRGGRGLLPGGSLAHLLDRHGRKRNLLTRPLLSEKQILAWADDHHRRTGDWPNIKTGAVLADPRETWFNIDQPLRVGTRGLPGGDSLAQLLARRRGVRNQKRMPFLTIPNILTWAKTHQRRFGAWPTGKSGQVYGQTEETWRAISGALRSGVRGLPGGDTLGQLLYRTCGVRDEKRPPPLTIQQILNWADVHHRHTGKWPTHLSGRVAGTMHENWASIVHALANARRGLPAGWTLARLLEQRRGYRHKQNRPRLTDEMILRWADAHRKRTGQWPSHKSGAVVGARDENWNALDAALRTGRRGLRRRSSLSLLLKRRRGKPQFRR